MERLFGPSRPGPGLRRIDSFDRLFSVRNVRLTYSEWMDSFGQSLPGKGKSTWARRRWIASLDRHFLGRNAGLTPPWDGLALLTVTSLWRKVGLTPPEMDRLFGQSLRVEGESTWPRLRPNVCLDSHFPGKESQPDHASDETSNWTVSSQGGISARAPQMNGLCLCAWTTALIVQKICKTERLLRLLTSLLKAIYALLSNQW